MNSTAAAANGVVVLVGVGSREEHASCGTAENLMGFGRSLGRSRRLEPGEAPGVLGSHRIGKVTSIGERTSIRGASVLGSSTRCRFSRRDLRTAYAKELLDSLPRRFGAVVRARIERCFGRHSNADNPYAHALLLDSECVEDETPDASCSGHRVEAWRRSVRILESTPAQSFDAFIAFPTSSTAPNRDTPSACPPVRSDTRHRRTPSSLSAALRNRPGRSTTIKPNGIEVHLWGVVDVRCRARGRVRDRVWRFLRASPWHLASHRSPRAPSATAVTRRDLRGAEGHEERGYRPKTSRGSGCAAAAAPRA